MVQETQFKRRVRLIDEMPRQAASLEYIASNSEALSESQIGSLQGAASMMRQAAKLLEEL